MILFIVTDTIEKYRGETGWYATRNLLEELARDACVVLHYSQVNSEALARISPWAICHSGCSVDFKEYDVLECADYRRDVRETCAAQIGFCGGHQILAHFFGSTLGPIRKLRPDEPDPSPYRPGWFKEWGVYPVRVVKPDPLFRGLGKILRVQEYHYWEVKQLAKDLEILASSRECRVEAFRHRAKNIYGTQFHPEHSPKTYQDGIAILKNFFAIARAARKPAASASRRK